MNSENHQVHLKQASVFDIPVLIRLEKSVTGMKNSSIVPSTVAEWVEDLKNGVVYLLEKDDIVVGDVMYEKKKENHIQITGLVVTPEFQRQGIAREAMNQVLEELKNIKRIDLVTHPDNVHALKLYQSLGFVIESRKENYFGDGEPRLVLVLEK